MNAFAQCREIAPAVQDIIESMPRNDHFGNIVRYDGSFGGLVMDGEVNGVDLRVRIQVTPTGATQIEVNSYQATTGGDLSMISAHLVRAIEQITYQMVTV